MINPVNMIRSASLIALLEITERPNHCKEKGVLRALVSPFAKYLSERILKIAFPFWKGVRLNESAFELSLNW